MRPIEIADMYGIYQLSSTMTPSRGPTDAAYIVIGLTRIGDLVEVKQGEFVWAYRVARTGRLIPV